MFNQRLSQQQLPDDINYLGNNFLKQKRCPVMNSQQFNDPHTLLEAYRQRARRYVMFTKGHDLLSYFL